MSTYRSRIAPFLHRKPSRTVSGKLLTVLLPLFLIGLVMQADTGRAQSFKTEQYPVLTSDPEAQPVIKRAVDSLYNMNPESAAKILEPIRRECPDHPVWDLWEALEKWWQILPDLEDKSKDEEFYALLHEAADQAQKWLDEEPLHKDALLVKAVSYGFLARQLTNRGKWLKGMSQARKALGPYNDLKEHYPEAPPVIMGRGLYLYYADYVPDHYPITRSIMWLMPDGDIDKGLDFLWESTRKGVIITPEAKYQLGIILLDFEERPEEAINVFNELAADYPRNGYYVRVQVRVLMESDHVDMGMEAIERHLSYWREKEPPFLDVVVEELQAWKGWAHKEREEWDKAIEAFKKAKAVSYEPGREYRNANLMARYWLGYAYIQSGQAGLARRELGELERIDQDSEFIDRGSELLDRIGR